VTQLLAILKLVTQWIDEWRTARKQRKAQDARDALEQNPNDWFDDHFAGGSERVQPDAQKRTGTDQANDPDHPQ